MAPDNETARSAAADMKSAAGDAANAAREEAARRADGAKRTVADEIGGVASALKKASGDFEDNSMEARAFRQIADSLAGASDSIRQQNLGEMVGGLNDFARRHPATFLGAAALLGFAASRFAVASQSSGSEAGRGYAAAGRGAAGDAYPRSATDPRSPTASTTASATTPEVRP